MTSIMLATLLGMSLPANVEQDAADTLVVCPAELRAALQPWVEFRAAQGHVIAFVPHSSSPHAIRRSIREHAAGGRVQWILLVGDAPEEGRAAATWQTPTNYYPAKVISRFGPDTSIATDNDFADLDGDGRPDVAIGRLPADSPNDLAAMVQKILAHENASPNGLWRQQINFVAGAGNFGALIDSAIEMATRSFLTNEIPASYRTTMTYGSWRSPFCPDPRRFGDVAIERMNEGCLFWVYIGHGHPLALAPMRVPGGAFRVLDVNNVQQLQCHEGQPVALMLACYTAAFDTQRDCLAEEMLRVPGGPVSVIGGSRLTMPYAMAVLGTSMMHECFTERRATLGELMLHTKRNMLDDIADPDDARQPTRQLLDTLATLLTMNGDREALVAERREHVALFQILGDPLLRLRAPEAVELIVDRQAVEAGSVLPITIRSAVSGNCRLELVCRRDQFRYPIPPRAAFDASEQGLADLHACYQLANDDAWVRQSLAISAAESRTELLIPREALGPCVLRAYVEGAETYALGSFNVFVQPPAVPRVGARNE